jgi:hypothetical protein
MSTSTRFWIGGGGALLPLLVTLLAADLGPLIDHPAALSVGTYVGAAIRYLMLFAIGGVVAALNSDEVQPIKLVQLGIAAPALISTYVNAQTPKPVTQTATVHVMMLSLDVVSTAHATGIGGGGQRPIVVAQFFSDVLKSAIAPLPRVVTPPPAPPPSVQDKAAVDRAIENAGTSAASAALAAERAASDAAKLDHQSTPEAITSVQKSADDARSAAQKTQQDIKALGEVRKLGAMR